MSTRCVHIANTTAASTKGRRSLGSLGLALCGRLSVALLTALIGFAAVAKTQEVGLAELFPDERQARTMVVINKVLDRFHYRD
ncbi:hypothetical protein, partial [Halochromatium sp.]